MKLKDLQKEEIFLEGLLEDLARIQTKVKERYDENQFEQSEWAAAKAENEEVDF